MSPPGGLPLPALISHDTTRLRVPVVCLFSLILAWATACHRSPKPGGGPHSRASAGSIDAGLVRMAASPLDSGAPRLEAIGPNCGLSIPKPIELMPMLRNKLVVAKSLHSVKLLGVPRLINEPDDFEMYYLAESAIDTNSAPTRVQHLVGSSVSFVNAPDCQAKLGQLTAWAWADEEGPGWKVGNPSSNAARTFRDGDSFLVANLSSSCSLQNAIGATASLPTHHHTWQVRALSEEDRTDENVRLMQRGLTALESEAALAIANARYARLRRDVAEPLPEHWWLLPRSYVRWSLATDGDAALLMVELRGEPVVAKHEFSAAWFGIWCIGNGGRLESLGLDSVPHELSDTITNYRHHLEVAGAPGELPLILYSYYAMRPEGASTETGVPARYRVYNFTLPAPPRLD